MSENPKEILSKVLSEGLSRRKRRDLDLLRIAELSMPHSSNDTDEELEEILSLDPEMRAAWMGFRKYAKEESEQEWELCEDQREEIAWITHSTWTSSIRVVYSAEGLFRVTQWRDTIHLSPWLGTVFAISKRMRGAESTGIWPSHQVDFAWPGDKPVLQGRIRVRNGSPVFTVRFLENENPQSGNPVEIDYWREDSWVGRRPLSLQRPEMEIQLKSGSPYLFCANGPQKYVLKINCVEGEFSLVDLRVAALLRVLMGDMTSGFELLRNPSHSSSQSFRWVLGLLSRCPPADALMCGYVPVRDDSAMEETKTLLKDLFAALAAGWIGEDQSTHDSGEVIDKLRGRADPISHGYVLALQERYEEALPFLGQEEKDQIDNPYVTAARYLTRRILFGIQVECEELPILDGKDLDTAMQCLQALRRSPGEGEEDYGPLADCLISACQ